MAATRSVARQNRQQKEVIELLSSSDEEEEETQQQQQRHRSVIHRRQQTTPPQPATIPTRAISVDSSSIDSSSSNEVEKEEEQQEEECPICSDVLDTNDYKNKQYVAITQNCNHRFHEQCLQDWLQRDPSCPICRTTISSTAGNGTHVAVCLIDD